MSRMDEALRELGAEYRGTEAPADLKREVMRSFRPAKREWGLAWMAAPAAAVLCVTLWMTRLPQAERLELGVWAPEAPAVAVSPKPAVVAARVRKPRAKEIVSDFFPLRSGPVLQPGEVGQVVRTRLPRREVRQFGFLWAEMQDGPDLPADVLVGWDGSARAVRFVHAAMNR